MQLSEFLLPEFRHEMASTRKILAYVPVDKLDYKPHAKAKSLQQLVDHILEIPSWVQGTFLHSGIDFATADYKTPSYHSLEEALTAFDKSVAAATECLSQTSNETMNENWTMRNGETIFFTMSKLDVYRSFVLNHLIHHRGQLATYLRSVGSFVPGLYGPSADEPQMDVPATEKAL